MGWDGVGGVVWGGGGTWSRSTGPPHREVSSNMYLPLSRFCCGGEKIFTSGHLIDRVFPQLPVRQWVLSVPKCLRYYLQRDKLDAQYRNGTSNHRTGRKAA